MATPAGSAMVVMCGDGGGCRRRGVHDGVGGSNLQAEVEWDPAVAQQERCGMLFQQGNRHITFTPLGIHREVVLLWQDLLGD